MPGSKTPFRAPYAGSAPVGSVRPADHGELRVHSDRSQPGVAGVADATEPAALTTPMFLAVHGRCQDALCAEAADRELAEVIRAATADAVK